jgi:ribonucleotide monophosphatase NagD (HAD superfamily)
MLNSGAMVPGGGSFVKAVQTAANCEPVNTGKPSVALSEIIMTAHGLTRPERVLMIGDRLDTDMLFGNQAGMRTCLVLTVHL